MKSRLHKRSKKEVDIKVKDYIERARQISIDLWIEIESDYETNLVRMVEIAKMIQQEELKELMEVSI